MSDISITQANFTAGAVALSITDRINTELYQAGVKILINGVVTPQGGVRRRYGTTTLAVMNARIVKSFSFLHGNSEGYLFNFMEGGDLNIIDLNTYSVQVVNVNMSMHIMSELRYASNGDVIIFMHEDLASLEFRVASNIWSYASILWTAAKIIGVPNAPLAWARGDHPRCGTFFQGRLYIGGTREIPTTIFASDAADYHAFTGSLLMLPSDANIEVGDTAAFFSLIQGSGNRYFKIVELHVSDHLQVFTTNRMYFIPASKDKAVTYRNITYSLGYDVGMTSETSVLQMSGTSVLLSEYKQTIIQLAYNGINTNYAGHSLSLVAGDILRDPAEITYHQDTTGRDTDVLYAVNKDGTLGVLSILSQEKIAAWSRFETPGSIEHVLSVLGTVFLIVERAGKRHLEAMDSSTLLDATRPVSSLINMAGDSIHNNKKGLQPYLKDDPTKTLKMVMLSTEMSDQQGTTVGRKRRIIKALLSFNECANVYMRVGRTDYTVVKSRNFQQPNYFIDGSYTIRGILGWFTRDALEIYQKEAAPFYLRSVTKEMQYGSGR